MSCKTSFSLQQLSKNLQLHRHCLVQTKSFFFLIFEFKAAKMRFLGLKIRRKTARKSHNFRGFNLSFLMSQWRSDTLLFFIFYALFMSKNMSSFTIGVKCTFGENLCECKIGLFAALHTKPIVQFHFNFCARKKNCYQFLNTEGEN